MGRLCVSGLADRSLQHARHTVDVKTLLTFLFLLTLLSFYSVFILPTFYLKTLSQIFKTLQDALLTKNSSQKILGLFLFCESINLCSHINLLITRKLLITAKLFS